MIEKRVFAGVESLPIVSLMSDIPKLSAIGLRRIKECKGLNHGKIRKN